MYNIIPCAPYLLYLRRVRLCGITFFIKSESMDLPLPSSNLLYLRYLLFQNCYSVSKLGDSHDSYSLTSTSTSPSGTSLSWARGVRRSTPRSSRTYSSSYSAFATDETSDKENTGITFTDSSSDTYAYAVFQQLYACRV
jgi:hypothetical protein